MEYSIAGFDYDKGPFLYYVKVFWGFFEPPTHLRKDIFKLADRMRSMRMTGASKNRD